LVTRVIFPDYCGLECARPKRPLLEAFMAFATPLARRSKARSPQSAEKQVTVTIMAVHGSKLPALDAIKMDAPLRLDVAAALAFPDGSMTASGLRRESARGRLVIERIAGKDYTTLRDIGRMRELCRVESLGHTSGCSPPTADVTATSSRQYGASKMVDTDIAQATALRIANRLITQHSKTPLPLTLATGRTRRGKATVVPIK
jgi:hypothetical protein